jgi:uncharacterized lipoprotein YajG
MTKPILAALLASFLVAGCATDPATATNEQRTEPVYRTGSNIAVKNRDPSADGVVTMSREDIERARTSSMPAGTIPKSN